METWFGGCRRRRAATASVVVVVLCICVVSLCSEARLSVTRQKLEVRRHLKRLNKPAVKSIQSPDGDVTDCIPVEQQPAFDHPFLKDHKIQLRPCYHPEGLFTEKKVSTESRERPRSNVQLWHLNGRYTEGTIPVRRTKEDDVLRASSVKRYGRKKHKAFPQPRSY